MPIHIQCGICQKKLAVKNELQGKTIKCPSCGERIRVVDDSNPPPNDPAITGAGSNPQPTVFASVSKAKAMTSVGGWRFILLGVSCLVVLALSLTVWFIRKHPRSSGQAAAPPTPTMADSNAVAESPVEIIDWFTANRFKSGTVTEAAKQRNCIGLVVNANVPGDPANEGYRHEYNVDHFRLTAHDGINYSAYGFGPDEHADFLPTNTAITDSKGNVAVAPMRFLKISVLFLVDEKAIESGGLTFHCKNESPATLSPSRRREGQ